ncbi:PucR family transcriptional regulator [Actinocorallia sp. A-T 12471]|uniref:PucR family transcriptional regulator n=1 Tax=Actinocorallia sp. A-T 12471 TaxID=3089813 RepID=UPI0029D03E8B|nr:PucR family transcriptional regulator [Actinocorallia sp. A-T 12471]MDX6743314.1 PucR family transcriptional regulator [Actinocorallia sp. A-T 12471]
MAPTLAAVAALPALRLLPRTEAPLDVPVRWVAVSELADPTPFLEGGELVLTTGMRLEDAETYVSRLVGRDVAGLGFGVGLGHDRVPPALVEAARVYGLPLLEVPRPTPFVAIGKAVSRMLAAEQYEDVTRAAKAQRELARAALRGPDAVLAVLARVLRGWALLLDPAGEVRYAAPDSARVRAPEIAVELPRLASAASLALPGPVVVQPVGLGRRPRAYLAVGTPDQLRPVAHTVVGAAVSLLSLLSETGEHRVREALGRMLLGGAPGFPDEPVRVLLCGQDAADALEGDPAADRCLTAPHGTLTAVIAPDALVERVAALAVAAGPVGVGEAVPLTEAARSLAQAERARPAEGVRRHSDLPGGVLGHLGDPAREAAADLLAPLDPSLRASLHAYLAHHGQGDPAARALGVHRHTLRHRMRRAADLLARDLDDPTTRAELWIALTLTDPPPPNP